MIHFFHWHKYSNKSFEQLDVHFCACTGCCSCSMFMLVYIERKNWFLNGLEHLDRCIRCYDGTSWLLVICRLFAPISKQLANNAIIDEKDVKRRKSCCDNKQWNGLSTREQRYWLWRKHNEPIHIIYTSNRLIWSFYYMRSLPETHNSYLFGCCGICAFCFSSQKHIDIEYPFILRLYEWTHSKHICTIHI